MLTVGQRDCGDLGRLRRVNKGAEDLDKRLEPQTRLSLPLFRAPEFRVSIEAGLVSSCTYRGAGAKLS